MTTTIIIRLEGKQVYIVAHSQSVVVNGWQKRNLMVHCASHFLFQNSRPETISDLILVLQGNWYWVDPELENSVLW